MGDREKRAQKEEILERYGVKLGYNYVTATNASPPPYVLGSEPEEKKPGLGDLSSHWGESICDGRSARKRTAA